MHRLTYPAPLRERVTTDHGTWTTRAWTLAGVQDVLASGGFFAGNGYDFADRKVARKALREASND